MKFSEKDMSRLYLYVHENGKKCQNYFHESLRKDMSKVWVQLRPKLDQRLQLVAAVPVNKKT